MKAVVIESYGSSDVLQVMDIDIPRPSAHEVLIKVDKTSVNYADIKNRQGLKKKIEGPTILGLEAAGTIAEVGSEVKKFKVGQRVVAFPEKGSYAQYTVANEALTFAIPNEIDFTTAAASPIVSFLSYQLLKDIARMQLGETVLIHAAAGGVGSTAIQMAKVFGAKTVIGTVSREEKFSTVLAAGADLAITYEDFSSKVNEYTDGDGVNLILDSVSGSVFEESFACLALYGKIVHFGNTSNQTGRIPTTALHSSCRSVLGFSFGTTRKKRPDTIKPVADEVFKLLVNGDVQVKVGAEYSLYEVKKAHEMIENRENNGKIVLTVS
ncbi:quinone oxidoreductase family protein [Cytobacillus sp. FSL R7-0680]|uniref:quinone oxidoreductase family protein n=1 Tax=Cytobacillus sp. FSL R7-0680 TaxID=2921689 RepID=UPI0030F5019A